MGTFWAFHHLSISVVALDLASAVDFELVKDVTRRDVSGLAAQLGDFHVRLIVGSPPVMDQVRFRIAHAPQKIRYLISLHSLLLLFYRLWMVWRFCPSRWEAFVRPEAVIVS